MVIITKQGNFRELGKPIKETDHKLIFQLGSIWKHSINSYHYSQILEKFRRYVIEKDFEKRAFNSIQIH